MQKNKIQVVVADDNKEFGDVLANYLNAQNDIEVVGIARDGTSALELIITQKPDITILDVIMPASLTVDF